MAKTNGKDGGIEDKRRNLAAEIMALSPPTQGCTQRARFITLNELEVLAEALRDGMDSVVKPET